MFNYLARLGGNSRLTEPVRMPVETDDKAIGSGTCSRACKPS